MRTITMFLLQLAAVVLFASAFSPPACGQTAQQIEDAKRAEMERRAGENERRLSAWELRMAEVRRPPERRRDSALAYTQIREDYKQLQIVNNGLARSVLGAGQLDFKYVAKAVSEIRSRAARLKENLMLPEGEKPAERSRPEVGAAAGPVKSSLLVLDKLVMEFVDSPIFEQARKVDVQQAAKARRNLEEIIELSDQIKKSSEKLKNSVPKTP
jgi:hypothetical protein